jgi:Mg2+/Co2+ transporter CorC
MVRLGTPLILLLETLMPALTAESELTTDEEEIRLLARLGSQKGLIEADEAAMIAKVFQLNDLTARDLMLPRVSAPSLNGNCRIEELRDTLLSQEAPWWVVQAVDKKRARLNCIDHLLSQFDYHEVEHLQIEMPARVRNPDYIRHPVPENMIVPDKY